MGEVAAAHVAGALSLEDAAATEGRWSEADEHLERARVLGMPEDAVDRVEERIHAAQPGAD